MPIANSLLSLRIRGWNHTSPTTFFKMHTQGVHDDMNFVVCTGARVYVHSHLQLLLQTHSLTHIIINNNNNKKKKKKKNNNNNNSNSHTIIAQQSHCSDALFHHELDVVDIDEGSHLICAR